MSNEYLLLKWGTLKGWNVESEASEAALRRYFDAGVVSMGAMQQRDNAAQIDAICDLIDAIDGYITNDWSGKDMTKDEAKTYVREYHDRRAS